MYPKRNPLVNAREFDDIVLLINTPKGRLHELDQISTWLWQRFDGQHNIDQLAQEMESSYDVTQQQAKQDIEELLQAMEAEALVSISKTPTTP